MPALIVILLASFLVASSSIARGEGAIAVGETTAPSGVVYPVAVLGFDRVSRENAINKVMKICTDQKFRNCRVVHFFSNTCVAWGMQRNGWVIGESDEYEDDARKIAATKCVQRNGQPCDGINSLCDLGASYEPRSVREERTQRQARIAADEAQQSARRIAERKQEQQITIAAIVGMTVLLVLIAVIANRKQQPTTFAQNSIHRPDSPLVPQSTSSQLLRPGAVSEPIQLKLRRSQHAGTFGKVIFALDARVEPNAEQVALIKKHRLGSKVVYESSARLRHKGAALGHADVLSETPVLGGLGAGVGALFRGARAATRAAAAALSLKCTIDSLIAGQHIECKDMEELLEAEDAVREACQNLKAYLLAATSFDGSDQVHEI